MTKDQLQKKHDEEKILLNQKIAELSNNNASLVNANQTLENSVQPLEQDNARLTKELNDTQVDGFRMQAQSSKSIDIAAKQLTKMQNHSQALEQVLMSIGGALEVNPKELLQPNRLLSALAEKLQPHG